MTQPGWGVYLQALERMADVHGTELGRLDTTPERTAQLRGCLEAYREMGAIIQDIVSYLQRMEDDKSKRESERTGGNGDKPDRNWRFWGSAYRP